MPLTSGMRLGPYEIVSPLGSGGMGEVYRARDTRLGREVAVKVLPQHLSASPEVRARFEREAKTVSSLNHPHICTLYDVGREGTTDYLVMELVDGETLAQRLAKGALASGEALRLGAQIADALDRAHRAGVIHRDLKPGNVMLTRSGAKLMDFGLARATGLTGPGGGSGVTVAALTQSPTVAAPLTSEGTIVGTFQYMAPEQLEGKEADARSDLWSLGCVLYEMTTGKRAFEGRSQATLISAIMTSEPAPVSQVAPMSPPALDRVVLALLAKEPDERIQTAHDVKLQLQWMGDSGSQPGAPARRRGGRPWLAWGIGTLAILAATALALRPQGPTNGPVIRAVVPPPANAMFLFAGDNAGPPEISPDGRHVAFVAVDDERGARLWIRDLNSLPARPLAGTENATYPFWSPDSRSIGFFADLKLRRVDLATGQVFAICPSPGGRGGTWGAGGEIVFAPDFQTGLSRVPAMGGTPVPFAPCDTTRYTTYRWPQMLPDGRHFLYFAGNHRDVQGPNSAVWIGSLDGRTHQMLLPSATDARYGEGTLLYVQDSVLVARPFDAGALRFTGDAVPTAERVQTDPTTWKANFSISGAGVLVYQLLGGRQGSQIHLVDRAGHVLGTAGESGNHFAVTLTSDAKRVIYSSQMVPNGDIFVYDFTRQINRRLIATEDDEDMPILSPDGQHVAYTSREKTARHYAVRVLPLDGLAAPRLVYAGGADVWPLDWSSDGRSMLIGMGDFSTVAGESIAVISVDGDPRPRRVPAPAGAIGFAQFSHDGRWVAFNTVGGADPEVYIEPVPTTSSAAITEGPGRMQISTHGGSVPRWGEGDRELYYAHPDGMIVAVPIAPGTMQPGREIPLFRVVLRPYFSAFDMTPDGQRFVVNVLASEGAAPIVLVSGWKRELDGR